MGCPNKLGQPIFISFSSSDPLSETNPEYSIFKDSI